MYLTAWLPGDWSDTAAAAALVEASVAAMPLSSVTLATERPPALVLGYAGLDEAAIKRGVERMARVLEPRTGLIKPTKPDLRSDRVAG
jgi:GntR family transcriptional regulator/MocR family aminotransferase